MWVAQFSPLLSGKNPETFASLARNGCSDYQNVQRERMRLTQETFWVILQGSQGRVWKCLPWACYGMTSWFNGLIEEGGGQNEREKERSQVKLSCVKALVCAREEKIPLLILGDVFICPAGSSESSLLGFWYFNYFTI